MNEETFLSVLMRKLIEEKNKSPESFNWTESEVLEVFRGLVNSLREGVYSRHSKPIKATLKELGIKNNRASIDAIFRKE